MMGLQTTDQGRFFYDFCLADHVPADHLLRRLDRVLDLGDVRRQLTPFYSHTGRPSVDPELMIRMLLVGYCFGIRSERRLCDEVHLNLADRWFCRLGLEDRVPDHTTFSLNRHGRFRDSGAFRLVFESIVRRCMAAGLVGAEGFAIDASVMEADASRYRGVSGGEEIDWSDPRLDTRPVREYLAALDPVPNPDRKTPKVISLSPTTPTRRRSAANRSSMAGALTRVSHFFQASRRWASNPHFSPGCGRHGALRPGSLIVRTAMSGHTALFVSMGDGDRHADCRTGTGFAFDRQICYATVDCEWLRVVIRGIADYRPAAAGPKV